VGNSGWDVGGLAHCGGTILNNTVADNYGLGIVACSGDIRNLIVWGSRGTRASRSATPASGLLLYRKLDGRRRGQPGGPPSLRGPREPGLSPPTLVTLY